MDANKPVIEELEELKQRLQAKLESLDEEMKDIKSKYQSVLTTLELLGHTTKLDLSASMFSSASYALKGLTQAQALERIARNNGGRIKVKEAKRILLNAGLIRTAKNANNIIFNVIQREEGKFKRVAPGEYELVA
jgi:predicted nuclease with TOPRIM domain